tara:strand:+ start:7988 stop:8137 length:150 start_codon:yes stop_codon:yes gene_type:complete
MAHEETVNVIEPSESANGMLKTIDQQLSDANAEIEDLRMQIAWLERSYE